MNICATASGSFGFIFLTDILIKGGLWSSGQEFSTPLVVQYGATLFRRFHHLSRHPPRLDERTYIDCNVMRFINNAAQPLGDCGGWRMAMWCLIIQGTWQIKSVEGTQHPPLSLLAVTTSSNLSSFPSPGSFLK